MGRRIYERLYDGEPWERNYREEASNITRGLRKVCKNIAIFPVGKEDVKATEIDWLRHNPDWDKDPHPYTMHHNWIWEIATSHKLPWKEECWENNVKIIRKAVRKTLDMNKSESSFEQYLNEAIDSYPELQMPTNYQSRLMSTMTDVLGDYCKANNLNYLSADDILHTYNLTDDQKTWLKVYGQMWDKIQEL